MDITIIVPYDEGLADVGGDISAGIRVYPGRLQLEAILKLTEESSYPKRAVMIERTNGELDHVSVTFSNNESDEPTPVDPTDKYPNGVTCDGAYFEEDTHHKGHLSYEVHYSTMSAI